MTVGKRGAKKDTLPFSNSTIVAVLALVASMGGFGGYSVYKNYGPYGANFDSRPHTEFRVIDGDTLVIPSDDQKSDIRVRLLGVNAPEQGDCFAVEARKALEGKLRGYTFTFERDQEAVDDNGRLLRHVIITPEDPAEGIRIINAELLSEGFVRRQTGEKTTTYDSTYRTAASEAEIQKRGLWSACPTVATSQSKLREQNSAPHPKDCDIKGNISEKGYGKIYLLPACPNYETVTIDAKKGEQYFCSEKEAQSAGFTKSSSCDNTFR